MIRTPSRGSQGPYRSLLLLFVILLSLTSIPSLTAESQTTLSIADDAWQIEIYNPTTDKLSTISTITSMAVPLLLLTENQEYAFSFPLSYGAALGTTYLAKNLLKTAFGKERPQAYIDEFGIDDEDVNRSFPSGHTAMSFAAASFVTTAYLSEHPESPAALPAAGTTCALSLLTGVLRYSSGEHHPSDIFAGALLGIVIGSVSALVLY